MRSPDLRTGTRSFLLLLALFIAGCANRQDVMAPVDIGDTPTRRIDMLVATTRQPSDNPSLRYAGERGEDVRLDNIVVSLPPEGMRRPGTMPWPTAGRPDPDRSLVTVSAEPMTEAGVGGWFRRAGGGSGKALIFVHGFNNGFADATFRFAQLVGDLDLPAAPVLFTWPSRGNALDYVYDRESATYSRFGLSTVLEAAIASRDVNEITLVAHSMGGWLTMEALRDLALRHGRLSRKIRAVVLAAPDIDVDVFRRQVLELGPVRPSILVVYSRNDLALSLSRWLAGDIDRLGGADLRSHEAMLASYGISIIDASDAGQSDPMGHAAFAESDAILGAIATNLGRR